MAEYPNPWLDEDFVKLAKVIVETDEAVSSSERKDFEEVANNFLAVVEKKDSEKKDSEKEVLSLAKDLKRRYEAIYG